MRKQGTQNQCLYVTTSRSIWISQLFPSQVKISVVNDPRQYFNCDITKVGLYVWICTSNCRCFKGLSFNKYGMHCLDVQNWDWNMHFQKKGYRCFIRFLCLEDINLTDHNLLKGVLSGQCDHSKKCLSSNIFVEVETYFILALARITCNDWSIFSFLFLRQKNWCKWIFLRQRFLAIIILGWDVKCSHSSFHIR